MAKKNEILEKNEKVETAENGEKPQNNKKGRTRRYILLRVVIFLALSLVIGINVYLWNANRILKNDLPTPFGYGASVVLSGSMEPTVMTGDLVIIKETDFIEDGDIVIYKSGDDFILHRVIEKDGDTLITKGDANNVADEPITLSAVKGKLVARVPYVGRLVELIKTPMVTVLIIFLAVIMTELSYRRERAQDEDDLEAIKAKITQLKSESGENSNPMEKK